MIDGAGPRISKPGLVPGGNALPINEPTVADNGRDSAPILLARAEWVELCLPSDLCDIERSTKGREPNALPVREGGSSLMLRELWPKCPCMVFSSNRTLFARDAPLLGSSSESRCRLPVRLPD